MLVPIRKSWILRIGVLILCLLLAGGWWLAHRVEFRNSDEELQAVFADLKVAPRVHRYTLEDRTIRFAEFGSDSLPVIIMVHGAPSSLSFFRRFYKDTTLLKKMMFVGVDRPGYGYSDFGIAVTSIRKQARLLQPMIDRYTTGNRKVILAASSYGGPVVAKLAMNNPEKIAGILFISSSFAPGEEYTIPVVSYLLDSKWSRWFFPPILRVANDEKLSHKKALQEIQDGWENIRSKVILLHGKSDGLIYYSNAEYARERLINAASLKLVPLEGLGHSILYDRPDLVEKYLLELTGH